MTGRSGIPCAIVLCLIAGCSQPKASGDGATETTIMDTSMTDTSMTDASRAGADTASGAADLTPAPDTSANSTTAPAARTDTGRHSVDTMEITLEERRQIDAWLRANSDSLNMYGDPIGMMYTGGTPLFDESTGRRTSRYEYILRMHPDRPWRGGKQ